MFDELKSRADGGDAFAACRLAVELLECGQLQQLLSNRSDGAGDAEQMLARDGNLEGADGVARMQLRQLQGHSQCTGITQAQRTLATRYLRQAAEAGVNEAMVRYADGQAFGATDSAYGMLRHPEFDRWRRDAPGFARRALHQGDPSAVMILLVAHGDDNSVFASLVPDDAEAAQSYRALLGHLRGRPPQVRSDLEPAALARANARSHEMHRRFFKGAVFPESTPLTATLAPLWSAPVGASGRSPCE